MKMYSALHTYHVAAFGGINIESSVRSCFEKAGDQGFIEVDINLFASFFYWLILASFLAYFCRFCTPSSLFSLVFSVFSYYLPLFSLMFWLVCIGLSLFSLVLFAWSFLYCLIFASVFAYCVPRLYSPVLVYPHLICLVFLCFVFCHIFLSGLFRPCFSGLSFFLCLFASSLLVHLFLVSHFAFTCFA